jgi:hypothetical protein
MTLDAVAVIIPLLISSWRSRDMPHRWNDHEHRWGGAISRERTGECSRNDI